MTGSGELPEVPGRTVARFALGERADRTAAQLVEQLAAGPIVPSDRADALIAAYDDDIRPLVEVAVTFLESDPEAAVRNEAVIDLLREGYLESPRLDADLLDTMAEELGRSRDVWGDDRFAVVVELLP